MKKSQEHQTESKELGSSKVVKPQILDSYTQDLQKRLNAAISHEDDDIPYHEANAAISHEDDDIPYHEANDAISYEDDELPYHEANAAISHEDDELPYHEANDAISYEDDDIQKEGIKEVRKGGLDNMSKPISNVDVYYTGEIVEKDGISYSILNTDPLINKFGSDETATRGKKVSPTLIRKAIEGEKIDTYVKNGDGEYVHEGHVIAKEGQYIFQNMNDQYDVYIPGNQDVIQEYEGYENITAEFQPLVRKTSPSKILHEIIQRPTVIIVKSWGNYEQTLDKGATLKLEIKENGDQEVTGINKGGFDAWALTDSNGNIIKNVEPENNM